MTSSITVEEEEMSSALKYSAGVVSVVVVAGVSTTLASSPPLLFVASMTRSCSYVYGDGLSSAIMFLRDLLAGDSNSEQGQLSSLPLLLVLPVSLSLSSMGPS